MLSEQKIDSKCENYCNLLFNVTPLTIYVNVKILIHLKASDFQ